MTAPPDGGPAVFAELACATDFSFLRGASHPQDLVLTAVALGLSGLGIADRNSVAGVVRAHAALEELREAGLPPPERVREGSGPGEEVLVPASPEGLPAPVEELRLRARTFRLAPGARLAFDDDTPDVVAFPSDRAAWGRLCRLLTMGNLRARKGTCRLDLSDLLAASEGLLLILMPPHRTDGIEGALRRLAEAAPGRVWLGAAMHRRGDDRRRLLRLRALAEGAHAPLLATNDALYAHPAERDLQDMMTCIREKVTIDRAGHLLEPNAERHLKGPAEMARLFRDAPEALAETSRLLDRVGFSLADLRYDYPDEPVPLGWTADGWLAHEGRAGLARRYPGVVPPRVAAQVEAELALIARLDYARYFLTILDVVRAAEARGILCQGRGSAANSALCYALGITCVDPTENDLLFARFLSEKRGEPPDIDIDFEHERREEIIQHIYARYGRDRAGIIATVIRYRPRSAMREVGKALGLSVDVTARLASSQWGSWGRSIEDRHIAEAGLDPANPLLRRALDLARRLMGHPRHLSQHVGGFVLTRGRLDDLVPIGPAAMEGRTFVEWDKDDVDALGLLKVDILALGMLTCIRKALDLLRDHGLDDRAMHEIPPGDPEVYAMLQRADSLGVFQVESRAQMNMLPRLRPREFYDLVIQVAIVRPGPIQGDMVHPYLRRRAGEDWTFPAPHPDHGPPDELVQVLRKTKGVPLFQEQAMRLAMVAARFTDVEANGLRRAMATFRHVGTIGLFEEMMVGRMVGRGYEPDFAKRCFEQIKGFGSYGFPESHAASFAKLVYVSSWIKCHHPAAFACALLNSQPMGFYAPAQIVRDAQAHGVEVRPVDVGLSRHDCALESDGRSGLALRLGFRQVDGIGVEVGDRIEAARVEGGFADVEGLARRADLPARTLRRLADADAMRSLGLDRRAALWAVRRLPDAAALPLFVAAAARELPPEADAILPAMSLGEHVAADYQTTRLSLKAHPMAILRPAFAAEWVRTCWEVSEEVPDGRWARVAGVVLVRQRPGNGNAVFVTIEDETGVANVVIWARLFERFRREVLAARLMLVEGRVQRSPEGVAHLMAARVLDRSMELNRLSEDGGPTPPLAPADEVLHPQHPRGPHHPRDARLLPRSRDFH